jgi:cysteinyl-tRNA synthetase
MITINGRKMGKSYNNVIKLTELFSGTHPLLEKGFHPMTVRFFILQTHYSSTLDFSNEALIAAEKGLKRLWDAYEVSKKLSREEKAVAIDQDLDKKVNNLIDEFAVHMDDDFSTAKVLANMFELVPIINSMKDGIISSATISASTFTKLQQSLKIWLEDILGLKAVSEADNDKLQAVMQLLIEMRKDAKANKDFATSDKIRNQLAAIGIQLKDEKGGGMSWSIES